MSKKKEAVEALKTLIIITLTITALFLTNASGLIEPLMIMAGFSEKGEGQEQAETGKNPGHQGYGQAAKPYVIVLTLDDGSRCALKYSDDVLEAYEEFSIVLGEALGSAAEPEAIPQYKWRNALKRPGVFFDYYYNQPAQPLSAWLGSPVGDAMEDISMRRLFITESEGYMDLYFIGGDDGEHYYCKTALPYSPTIGERMSAYSSNGAYFAFEGNDELRELDPYFVFLETMPRVPSISMSNPLRRDDEVQRVLECVDMNSYLVNMNVDSDGVAIFVEGERTLRVYPDGLAVYKNNQKLPPAGGAELSAADAVEMAWTIAKTGVGALSNDARLGICSIGESESGDEITICFNYRICGLPVVLAQYSDAQGAEEFAVEVVLSRGVVKSARMIFREMTVLDEYEFIVPEYYAAAMVDSKGAKEPRLSYIETSGEAVNADWRSS